MTRMQTLAAAALVLGGVCATTPLSAETVTRRVSYADLDLTTKAGVKALKQRVAVAVEGVCGTYVNADAQQAEKIAACRKALRPEMASRIAAAVNARGTRLSSLDVVGPEL